MALREGIDTDYDEGDQFEEETVRLMFMFKLVILFSSKLCVLIGRVPDQGGGDDHSRLEDDGSLTICRLVPSVFSLMINRDILENLVIRNPLCIWTLLMLRNRIQATILFVKKLLSSKVQDISGFKWFWAQMSSMYSF